LALRILFDYMARHSRFPQSARQIEDGIRADRFYTQYASNVLKQKKHTKGIPRSYVRVYIQRLRFAIEKAFNEAGLLFDSRALLLSEETVANEVGYRLKAVFESIHIEI
jgi:hypothetical protein